LKYLITSVLFLISLQGSAQTADSICQIIFRHDIGSSSFREPGKYATTEVIEYSRIDNNFFKISKYLHVEKSWDTAQSKIIIDSTFHRTKDKINNEQVRQLVHALNSCEDNFDFSFIRPHLKAITRRETKRIARDCDEYDKFKNDYSDHEERRELIKKLKHFDKLDSFMSRRVPDLAFGRLCYTDAWNYLDISILHENGTTEYSMQFFELFGQPVNRLLTNHDPEQNLNLRSNLLIRAVIPKKSITSLAVDFNTIKRQYIAWYLRNFF
jgi:hypothetical protein